MSGIVFAVITPLVISQLYQQPVVYYQVPYAGPIDAAYGQEVTMPHVITQPAYIVQTPYLQGSYQQLQFAGLQNGLPSGLALGLYQNTLARELTGGYLNEFRDASGSLNNNEPSGQTCVAMYSSTNPALLYSADSCSSVDAAVPCSAFLQTSSSTPLYVTPLHNFYTVPAPSYDVGLVSTCTFPPALAPSQFVGQEPTYCVTPAPGTSYFVDSMSFISREHQAPK